MGIAEYNRKRNFKKTPEPRGRKRPRGSQLHFVVQKHDASHLHYDFRLELDGVLLSWAVPKGPSLNPKDKRLAMQTEDHPLSYIDFEGAIPEGSYGAGDVIVWDRGLYASSETADPEAGRKKIKSGFYKGEIKFVLLGEKLRGAFTLVKMKNDKTQNAWLLIKERDEYASTKDVTKNVQSVLSENVLPRDKSMRRSSFGTSPTVRKRAAKSAVPKKKVPSGRKVPQRSAPHARTRNDRMPHHIQPMLAKLVAEPFDAPDWFFEVKWDGYRAIAEIENGAVRLYSRHGQFFNETYAPIVKALEKIPHLCVLDGEVVALKNGKPDFHTLQEYRQKKAPLQYVLFDLLYIDGEDLRKKPLRVRKELLREIMPKDRRLIFSEHSERTGKKFFRLMQQQHMEGMVAKDAASPYRENSRSGEWRKVKNIREQEAIILGYTQPRGSRKNLGALVLGAYVDGKLAYIGHSGGGFSQQELHDMCRMLEKIKVAHSPFDTHIPVNAPVTWVKPRYVCSVQFTEWTPEGHMRHPIYRGLRVDKDPEEVTRETPAPVNAAKKKSSLKKHAAPALTHLDKIFWPQERYTKGDLISYYERMADTILPYLKDRPENLNRNPNGIASQGFFQKNYEGELPDFVDTVTIHSQSRKRDDRYIVCNNAETLLFLANLGCIELNPWNSRVESLEKPDYMIIDLDPGKNTFDEIITVAREVHRVLEMACEEHFVKTSGKTGLHIYVPLGARYVYDEIREFSHLLVRIVHERLPDLTSIERSPGKRARKIYLDYLQNRFGQTIAAPYSVRPFPGATVSTPIEWREVKKGLDPAKFNIKTIGKRLEKKGDLWKPVLKKKVDLNESIRCLRKELGS